MTQRKKFPKHNYVLLFSLKFTLLLSINFYHPLIVKLHVYDFWGVMEGRASVCRFDNEDNVK